MGKENKYFLIFLKNWINSYFCFLFCLSLTSSVQTAVVYIRHSRSWLPRWSLVSQCSVHFYGLKKVFVYILSVFSTPSHLSEEFQPASVHEYFIFSDDPHLLAIWTNNRPLHPNSAACTVKTGIYWSLFQPLCMLYVFLIDHFKPPNMPQACFWLLLFSTSSVLHVWRRSPSWSENQIVSHWGTLEDLYPLLQKWICAAARRCYLEWQ